VGYLFPDKQCSQLVVYDLEFVTPYALDVSFILELASYEFPTVFNFDRHIYICSSMDI